MKKRLAHLFTLLCIVTALLTVSASAWSGSGTESSPYLLSGESDLRQLDAHRHCQHRIPRHL